MKKEIPILFSTPMVQAILAGRKTMTRRVVKPQPDTEHKPSLVPRSLQNENDWGKWYWDSPEGETILKPCPYGKPGDLLWVRESMYQVWEEGVFYSADNTPWDCPADFAYRSGNCAIPSIHIPKAAARIWLEVTGVRVERLHEINPHDACNEGVEYWNIDGEAMEGGELQADFKNYTWTERKERNPNYEDRNFPTFANAVDSFRTLWQSINGPGSWEANPWVWVVSFRVLSTTGKP